MSPPARGRPCQRGHRLQLTWPRPPPRTLTKTSPALPPLGRVHSRAARGVPAQRPRPSLAAGSHRTWPAAAAQTAALLLTYPFRTSPFATQPFARTGRRQQQPPGPGRIVPQHQGQGRFWRRRHEQRRRLPVPLGTPPTFSKPEMAARRCQFPARPSQGGGAHSRGGRG